MARILALFPSALLAARGGMTATQWYQQLREENLAPRQSEAYALFRVARSAVVKSQNEIFENPEEKPVGMNLPVWPTRKSTGIAQTVTIAYRDKTTGQLKQTWWRTVTDEGIEREQAIAMAVDAYSTHAESYNQDLIGAIHTSSYRLEPLNLQ